MVFHRKKKKSALSMRDFPPQFSQRYSGETHQIMLTTSGLLRAEFSGPGTKVKKRIDLGIEPINKTDAVAKIHDIAYLSIGNSKRTTLQKEALVRKADIAMINSLSKIPSINAGLPRAAIQAKIKAEDLGLLSKSRFINPT